MKIIQFILSILLISCSRSDQKIIGDADNKDSISQTEAYVPSVADVERDPLVYLTKIKIPDHLQKDPKTIKETCEVVIRANEISMERHKQTYLFRSDEDFVQLIVTNSDEPVPLVDSCNHFLQDLAEAAKKIEARITHPNRSTEEAQ